MIRSRALFVLVASLAASTVCACSLLYSSYDDRFRQSSVASSDGGGPFLVTEGGISELAYASSELFVAVGGNLYRVDEDGGTSDLWWAGDASSETIVALSSDRADTILWTYGSGVTVPNRVLLSPTSSSAMATELDNGAGVGNFVGLAKAAAWSLPNSPMRCTKCPVASVHDPSGGAPVALELDYEGGSPSAVGAKAIAVDSEDVDVLVTPARFMRFGFDGSVKCSTIGFAANVAAIASTPDASALFLLNGNGTDQGTLARYENGCPTLDGGVTLAPNATLVTADDSAVYWATSDGHIFRAAFASNAGTEIGQAPAAPVSIAVGSTYLYAAVGSTVYRYVKAP